MNIPRRNIRTERGQTFMELAVSVIFLLILLSVVIDLGWAFYTLTSLRDTAQEAASYGIMCPDKDRILQRLRLSTTAPLNMQDIDDGNVSITYIDPLNGGAELATGMHGDIVHISVEIQHQIIVPFVGTFIGRPTYPLKVDISDTIMVDECPKQ